MEQPQQHKMELMVLSSRGGKRIRVNAYQNTTTQDIVLGVDLLDKELTNGNTCGKRVWIPIYRGKAQRPSQAVKCFVWHCIDSDLIRLDEPARFSVEYWARDMNLNKRKRVTLIEPEKANRNSLNKVPTQ